MSNQMTDEMVLIAVKLHDLAKQYRELYSKINGNTPVIWIKSNDTGETVVIADGFNGELIKNCINT